MILSLKLPSATASPQVAPPLTPSFVEGAIAQGGPSACGAPICCKNSMTAVVRRARIRPDGEVRFSSVWSCTLCGLLIH